MFGFLRKKSERDIWALGDTNDFLIALYTQVAEKCGYGENVAALSAAERIIYITQSCEAEVNNGGFSQYFFNSAGDLSGELAAAFETIGAERTARICERALGVFDGAAPTDREARSAALDAAGSRGDGILAECDEAFYRYEDDLAALCRAYAEQNRAFFSR